MKDVVTDFIKKHQLLLPDTTVLVAVSGGPDSMALLHFFKSIQVEWNLRLIALSVDHQLRGEESKEDLEYVEKMCQEWDIEFIGTSVDVMGYKKNEHIGTQIAARKLRYDFFADQMKHLQADYLAFGHHGDDQAETMLMKMVRSADSRFFSGMPVKREFAGGVIIRPLLCVTKKELENYCQINGIVPRIDPSNASVDYTRNFYRIKVLPLLKSKNGNLHKTIQHLSESLEADEDFLQLEAKKMFKEVVQLEGNPITATFKIDDFVSRASALQRRVYHLILKYLYHNDLPKDLSYVHEEQLLSLLAKDKRNVQIDFPRHLKVEKAYNKLIFYFQEAEKKLPNFHEVLNVPGEVLLPNGNKLIARYQHEFTSQNENTYICLQSDIMLPLHIRTRRDGDRMSWKGLNGSKKLKDIFIDAKIPIQDRNSWPIVTDNNGDILWLVGLKKRDPIPNQKSSSYIQLYYE
ncbi:tRNA lysidine(34) synthetase TilS [Paucisalibacillus sp. EB02]|uniref:tRNA lysidine(34) synthetase TilS n=1 Tax=Paucisalibacillus sp. EB02 TaxID=1347087 RepID=UPI0004B6ECC8|nr:tRNA lysidine(34) synthetase TilS [Paucisalibacillus sp. EB02]